MRICLFSGPGAGKSTTASRIFYELKVSGYSVDLVTEYIKKWAFLKRVPESYDQVYVFGHQLHEEDIRLRNVEHIVTDSPLAMQVAYAIRDNNECWEDLINISRKFEKRFPSINIFLNRDTLEYQQIGRYENYDAALKMDNEIKNILSTVIKCDYQEFKTTDIKSIMGYVKSKL